MDTECDEGYEFIIQIDVLDVGSWLLKFRESDLIYNNRNLILDCVRADATICFRTTKVLKSIIDTKDSIHDNESCGNLKQIGSQQALDFFWSKVVNQSSIGSSGNIRINSLTRANKQNENMTTPIKSGWLLKRRDIISGWRRRFFIVFEGRLEYFIGENDILARGVIPLAGAEVIGPKRIHINGVPDSWCLLVEPKNKDKAFRLASEQTGPTGMSETSDWVQAFLTAARYVDGTSETSSVLAGGSTTSSHISIGMSASHATNPFALRNIIPTIFAKTSRKRKVTMSLRGGRWMGGLSEADPDVAFEEEEESVTGVSQTEGVRATRPLKPLLSSAIEKVDALTGIASSAVTTSPRPSLRSENSLLPALSTSSTHPLFDSWWTPQVRFVLWCVVGNLGVVGVGYLTGGIYGAVLWFAMIIIVYVLVSQAVNANSGRAGKVVQAPASYVRTADEHQD